MKCITLCTQNSENARHLVTSHPTGARCLIAQLKHADEMIVGNAALALGHCVTSSKDLSSKMADSNVVMELLVLARDGRKTTAQHNCAILIAKLCQTDSRLAENKLVKLIQYLHVYCKAHLLYFCNLLCSHLERLRELHGLEILHDVLKHVKE